MPGDAAEQFIPRKAALWFIAITTVQSKAVIDVRPAQPLCSDRASLSPISGGLLTLGASEFSSGSELSQVVKGIRKAFFSVLPAGGHFCSPYIDYLWPKFPENSLLSILLLLLLF